MRFDRSRYRRSPCAFPADLRPLRRELLCEALDGAIVQAAAAIRFTEKGYDDGYARAAIKRATELFRTAVNVTNELAAENRRIAAGTDGADVAT